MATTSTVRTLNTSYTRPVYSPYRGTPPKCALPHLFSLWLESFPSHLGPSHVRGIFILSLLLQHLMQRYLLAVAHHSIRCFFLLHLFCPQQVLLSRGFGLSSSQSCHASKMKAGVLMLCVKTSSLLCWTVVALICAMTPPSIIAPSFSSSTSFSLPSVKKNFDGRHLLLLLGAMHFDVFDLHQYAFLMNSVQISPNQDPQVGVLCFWANARHFTSSQTINYSFLSTCTIPRPIAFLRRHKNAVSSTLFMVCCTSQRSVHPVHRRAEPPTSHTRAHVPETPNREPSVATWFWRAFGWNATTRVFPIPTVG